MYAWTVIKAGEKTFQPGDSVNESDFDQDDWDQLVASRSVREVKFPNMPADYSGSPKDFRDSQLRKQMDDLDDNEAWNNLEGDDGVPTGSPEVDSPDGSSVIPTADENTGDYTDNDTRPLATSSNTEPADHT